MKYVILCLRETREPGGLPSFSEGLTLQTKERRDANVCYIFGSDPDRYLHCHSHRIVLHDLWEKKIAAHYCNSERLVNKTVL